MLKKTLLILGCFSIVTVLASFTFEKKQKAIKTIVIDAGHGIESDGGYNGAKGSYSYEDEICYEVSKKLVKEIAKEFPEIRIIETRPERTIVDLHERARIANHNKGDLFISIHVNAAPPITQRDYLGTKKVVSYTGKGKKRKKVTREVPQYRTYKIPNPAKGTETYIWGSHKNEDKEVAMRENAPMFNEENYKEKYGDIDPNSPDFIALSLLKTKQFFKRSATLSGMVEEQFAKVGRTSRGQRQRQVGIWVLQATAMPSILVETGYITNKEEEDYLNSESGQQEIAECVTNAVKNYITWLEKQGNQNLNTGQATVSNNDQANMMQFLKQIDEHEHSK
ncbi:N-acetylmuramoyl-L-alanine amidase [Chitinophagaceae bacterium LB-8]|uniref:N-acetylmuramoyl-L-alanine amidase n=1 Tax=Paraflavisolibacter caeni TaxID=2982496 RepID=A0A9X2XZ89_9BACT|nr:N-acetylmuramoyl-L-alanine amidase [Paraflavisolibacter caeni]MCU7550263.1 N-acetylmuramoyl-L-alanine amidase [Paraflavisolibacter caeni]